MSCTSPLYRIPVGSRNFNNLIAYDQKKLKNHGVFLKFNQILDYGDLLNFNEIQVIGCGQCMDCRLASSRDWAVRCSLEAESHEFNYFVTLTYDDFHLPKGEFIDFKGDIYDSNLCRRDIQLFVKSLREYERTHNFNTSIKVFYCGEYGDRTSRPHYHLCVFGASEIPDLIFAFRKGKYTFYKSSIYESFWNTSECGFKTLRGFVDISEFSFDTAAYTARYVCKKQKGLIAKDFKDYYYSLSDPPDLRCQPFVGMSLKPAIASEYYSKHKFSIQEEDLVKYHKQYEVFKSKPPRYFDKLFDREDPDKFSKVVERRKKAGIASRESKLQQISESLPDYLSRQAEITDRRVKRYVRDL